MAFQAMDFSPWFLTLTIIFLGVILYASIAPVPYVKGAPSYTDKIIHFFLYFWLALLIFLATRKASLAFFLAGTYGLLMEALQFTLPFRSFSFFDLLINFAGAGIVLLFNLCSAKTFK